MNSDPDPEKNVRGSNDAESSNYQLLETLSPRQREVYRWICEGKRDREIATILNISYRTVTVHVSAILAKLGVENRTCAAMLAKNYNSDGGSNGNSPIAGNTHFYVFIFAGDILFRALA